MTLFPRPVALLLAVLLSFLAAACGRRPGLGVYGPDGTVPVPDGSADGAPPRPDASPPPDCLRVEWPRCEPTVQRLTISAGGDMPDVAWTGSRVLVVSEKEWGNEVVAVDSAGAVLLRQDLGGIQYPRIAWNPVLQVGLVAVDSGLRWLDATGRPAGDYVSAGAEGYQLSGDVSATDGGFFLVNGTNIYGTPPPLRVARLGPTPGPVQWEPLQDWGPRSPAEHVTGADGMVRWMASTVWYLDIGELYRVGPQGLELDTRLDGIFPQGGEGFVAGISDYQGRVYMLYGAAPWGSIQEWTQWMVELAGPEFRTWRIDRSHNGSDGHLLTLGDTLLLASSSIHPSYKVSLAVFDPTDDEHPIGFERELHVVAGSGLSRSPRMALTDRGFALVWWEEGSVYLEIYDCCVQPP